MDTFIAEAALATLELELTHALAVETRPVAFSDAHAVATARFSGFQSGISLALSLIANQRAQLAPKPGCGPAGYPDTQEAAA